MSGQPGDGTSFEDLLASPFLQFDPSGELLPHLIAFGPPESPRRPWLFDAPTNTTAAPWSTDQPESWRPE